MPLSNDEAQPYVNQVSPTKLKWKNKYESETYLQYILESKSIISIDESKGR